MRIYLYATDAVLHIIPVWPWIVHQSYVQSNAHKMSRWKESMLSGATADKAMD